MKRRNAIMIMFVGLFSSLIPKSEGKGLSLSNNEQALKVSNVRKGKKSWKPNGQIQERLESVEIALGWRTE